MPPRLPPLPATGNPPDVQALIDQASGGTGGALNIFLTLARHPGLLRRFLPFGGKLLAGGTLDPRQRELAILRTAWRCRAEYEWGQHVRIGRAAGLGDDEIGRIPEGPAAAGWPAADAAILAACDDLLDDHRLSDATWDALRARLDDRQLIELTMLVGSYAMVAGMLNSLGVEREPGVEGFPADGSRP